MFPKLLSLLAVGVLAVGPAFAATYHVTWSGSPFGNTASASAFIEANICNCGFFPLPDSDFVVDSVTVSGAGAGNGTFYGDAYQVGGIYGASHLDLGVELVGQPLGNGSNFGDLSPIDGGFYGGAFHGVYNDAGGDLNIFTGGSTTAPSGVGAFLLRADGGAGDLMRLTSVQAVPEPAAWSLMLVGLGLFGAVARRRRQYDLGSPRTCSPR